MSILIIGTVVGILATLLMDAWSWALKTRTNLPITEWEKVGHWLLRPAEKNSGLKARSALLVGWSFHYAVGIAYGIAYQLMLSILEADAGLIFAVVFSLSLLVAPWFLLQPAMGLGVLASRAANPWKVRMANISVHVFFGFGLYLGSLLFLCT